MSTTVTQTLQIGISTAKTTLAVPANPDGSLSIIHGERGGTNVLNIQSNGILTFPKSMIVGRVAPLVTSSTIDCGKANWVTWTPSGSETLALNNIPSGIAYNLTLDMVVDVGATVYNNPTLIGTPTTFSNDTKNGANVVINKPAGGTTGDLLFVAIAFDGGGSTFTPPAGWTEVLDPTNESGPYVAFREYTAAGSGPFTFDPSATNVATKATAWTIRNCASVINSGASTNESAPSLTTTLPNTLVYIVSTSSGSTVLVPRPAYSTIVSFNGGGTQNSIGVFQLTNFVSPGTTGIIQFVHEGDASPAGTALGFVPTTTAATAPTITWPASITWQDNVTPPTYYDATQRILLTTYNGGTSWVGSFVTIG